MGPVRPDLVGAGVPRRQAVLAGGAGARHQELRRGQSGGRRELRPGVQGPASRRHRRRHQAPRRRAAAGLRRRGKARGAVPFSVTDQHKLLFLKSELPSFMALCTMTIFSTFDEISSLD